MGSVVEGLGGGEAEAEVERTAPEGRGRGNCGCGDNLYVSQLAEWAGRVCRHGREEPLPAENKTRLECCESFVVKDLEEDGETRREPLRL